MEITLVIITVAIILLVVLIKGAIRAFKRQPIVAILCVIFMFPIFLIWAFIETFLNTPSDPPENKLTG